MLLRAVVLSGEGSLDLLPGFEGYCFACLASPEVDCVLVYPPLAFECFSDGRDCVEDARLVELDEAALLEADVLGYGHLVSLASVSESDIVDAPDEQGCVLFYGVRQRPVHLHAVRLAPAVEVDAVLESVPRAIHAQVVVPSVCRLAGLRFREVYDLKASEAVNLAPVSFPQLEDGVALELDAYVFCLHQVPDVGALRVHGDCVRLLVLLVKYRYSHTCRCPLFLCCSGSVRLAGG